MPLRGALGVDDYFPSDDDGVSGTLMEAEAFSVLMDLAMCVHTLDAEILWETGTAVVSSDIVLAEDREVFGFVGVVGCGVVPVEGLAFSFEVCTS